MNLIQNMIPLDVDNIIRNEGASTKKMRDGFIARVDFTDCDRDSTAVRDTIRLTWVWFAQGWLDAKESK